MLMQYRRMPPCFIVQSLVCDCAGVRGDHLHLCADHNVHPHCVLDVLVPAGRRSVTFAILLTINFMSELCVSKSDMVHQCCREESHMCVQ